MPSAALDGFPEGSLLCPRLRYQDVYGTGRVECCLESSAEERGTGYFLESGQLIVMYMCLFPD